MKTRVTTIAMMLLAVMALAGTFATAAGAQTPGTGNRNGNGTPPAVGQRAGMQNGGMMGMGAGMRMGGSENSLIAVAATKLSMTTTDLIAALGGTKSIAQVAVEHNVAVSTIIDAFMTPRIEQINAAVAAGRITQAQADTMIATMTTNVTTHVNEVWTARGNGNGTGTGMGTGFADADGDGVCDNMGTGGNGMQQGRMGRGMGNRP